MSKNYCKLEKKWCKYCTHKGCTFNNRFYGISFKTFRSCPKRESERTISFKELLNQVSFEDVMNSMCKYWPKQGVNIVGYRHVFNTLLNLKPTRTELIISCELNTYIDGTCINVSGVDKNKKYWAIEFVHWSEWLCMNIEKETLNNFSKEDIVASCLWEMTFNGYDEVTIRNKEKQMDDSFEEMLKEENANK